MTEKLSWSGEITSVQPRIRLLRSFDQRSHTYLGYAIRLRGEISGDEREFWLGLGKAAHEKHRLEVGDQATGLAEPVPDPRLEPVEFYRVSRFRVSKPAQREPSTPPPWHGAPPPIEVYRERGHRRLASRAYETRCSSCIWGSRMAVEMIVDHWNPDKKRYRIETFCYGPKSCRLYQAGPTRKVPGRRGMSWEEADWVDEDATAQRGPDD
jgi:hypothetical protein